MAHEFYLPDIGEGLTEATIISWYVDVGEQVGLDEPLVEVETDKAVVDIPAPYGGVVLHHGGDSGDVIEVAQLLAVVGEAGELWEAAAATDESAAAGGTAAAAPIVGTLDEVPGAIAAVGQQVNALPKVRKLAAERGVDLAGLVGSGVGGRITMEDVQSAAAPVDLGPVERVRMSATRRAIADNLSRAWREIPHVTTYSEVDAGPLLAKRAALGKPTVESLLIAALVPVLEAHPAFNATIVGDEIIYRKKYDVGFAVDTSAGLIVAVIRDAAGKPVGELDVEVRRLASAAKEQKLALEELRGQTFTLSNIGAVGGGYGTPIVPLGTSAILSVGRADERAVIREGQVAVGREFPLSLSYDHRIIDGATGRAFMADVVAALSAE